MALPAIHPGEQLAEELETLHMSAAELHPTDSEKASTSLRESPELEKAQRAFTIVSREAQFLFDDASGVHKVLELMHGDTIAVIGFKRDIGPKLGPPEVIAENQKCDQRQQRIRDSVLLPEKGMKKYLDFHALSVWRRW
jgi:hypothetical protein